MPDDRSPAPPRVLPMAEAQALADRVWARQAPSVRWLEVPPEAATGGSMTDQYILQGTTPVPEPDLLAWGRWFQTADRHVAETWVTPHIRVSTIFLGIDHALWPGAHAPILFETMVFGGSLDQEQCRYATWDEAEAGHRSMVEQVRARQEDAGQHPTPEGGGL
jgi:hypothetical protein